MYNHLNLPKKIRFQTGEITYLYDATGVKTQKIVLNEVENTQTTTHYSDGFQYTENQLDFFPHPEGYVKVLDFSEFHYVYPVK